MNSLVADYGTSSGESESDKSDLNDSSSDETQDNVQIAKLPKPDFEGSSSKKSVFSNPFVEAENAKKAILEKHVKMVPTKDKVEMINGKKICWNYRKGRCRFGHNCTFAHDSDLHKSKEEVDLENQVQSTLLCESSGQGMQQIQISGFHQGQTPEELAPLDPEEEWDGRQQNKKKRPGLSSNIVPGKKVMKLYKKQKSKDLK